MQRMPFKTNEKCNNNGHSRLTNTFQSFKQDYQALTEPQLCSVGFEGLACIREAAL
jgi:hypothetical protein